MTRGRCRQVAALPAGRVAWCAGRAAVVLDRSSGGQRVMNWHRGEITCLAAGMDGEEAGLVATADRLGVAGVWAGGLAAALVWNGVTGRVVGCVPGRDGEDWLGPVVALCFCPAAALAGRGRRGGGVGLVVVTCDGAGGFGLRVYRVGLPADRGGAGAGGEGREKGDWGEAGPVVGTVCWTGWGRCRMVHAVAAAPAWAGAQAGSGALWLVTAGRRHVRCAMSRCVTHTSSGM